MTRIADERSAEGGAADDRPEGAEQPTSFAPVEGRSGEMGPPGWLLFAALAPAVAVASFGLVGLALAINGWYEPAVAFPIGAVVWAAVMTLARPVFASRGTLSRYAHLCAALGVALILAITLWNAAHASQHVLINRDGGSYANTARWIARDGSLEVKPRVGPFASDPTIKFDSFAVYQMKNGTLQFQFAHLLPVVLAEAFAIRGNFGLFHAPEVLGGFALLAFFLLAWRLFRRPLFALSAMLALAFIVPQVSFSRDSYSEIPSQILLFTALWLLVSARPASHWRTTLTAGLLLGTLEAARVDAVAFLIGIPVFFAVAWIRSRRGQERRRVAVSTAAFAAGLVPGLAIGLIDLTRHSGAYYNSLASNVKGLALVSIASALACSAIVVLWPHAVPLLERLPRSALSSAAGALVGVIGFAAWFIRPRIQHLRGTVPLGLVAGLQTAEHKTVDPLRVYFERSMSWMSWYLGPLTLVVAIVGAALLTRELLRGGRVRVVGPLAVLAPGSALYLWRADAVPDHVWVTRRFLVSSFPLLILLAIGLAAACFGLRAEGRAGAALRAGAVIVAVAAVAFPLYTIAGVSSMTEQRGFLGVVTDTCADVGPHAAVVVLEQDNTDLFDDWIPEGIRSWCGAEVGITRGTAQPAVLRRLALQWSAQGRKLFVVAKASTTVQKLFPGARLTSTPLATNARFLRQALTHRPDGYSTQSLSISVAQVPIG